MPTRPVTLTFSPGRAMVMTHIHTKKNQNKVSFGSKDRMETNRWTQPDLVTFLLHTHTPIQRPFVRDNPVGRYQKGKTNLDFTEARDSQWQWHQLGHVQVCTSLQADNHASSPPLSFFTGRMPFLPPNQQCQSTERKLYKKLSYRRVTARCVLSVVILPITMQQCRNYLYNKS